MKARSARCLPSCRTRAYARIAATLSLFALLPAGRGAAASGYEELRREFDEYAPRFVLPPAAAGVAGAAPGLPAEPGAFADAAGRLRQLADEWGRALSEPAAATAFLVPDPALARTLAPAANDAGAAARALADGFTLETLEVLTLLRSPMIATREREAKAALETFDQAEQIDQVLRRYASLSGAAMGGSAGMARTADFPFPGVLALKGRIAAETVRAAREELEAARRDALTMARKSYWELSYVASATDVTARMLELLENLAASVSARYEAGETSFQDVVRVRIESEKAREELRTLTEERRNMEAEVRGLLALPQDAAVGVPGRREAAVTVPEQKAVEALALERRQELRAADAMIARMELMLEMVETMTYPGFDLGLSAPPAGLGLPAAGAAMAAGADAAMGAAPAAPAAPPARPLYAGDEAYVRELSQRVASLRSERDAVRATTLVGVRSAWFGLDRARREALLYGERVLPLTQSAIESSLRGYTAGRVMFSDLLESYTGWLEAGLARERARADAGSARAALDAAAGVSGAGTTP